jgi:Spy/CpxP family protein refolding chaperone
MRARVQVAGLVFALLLPLAAHADSPEPAAGPIAEYHVGLHGPDFGVYAGIPLAAAQRAQIQQIMAAYRQLSEPMASQLRQTEEQLRQLMLEPGAFDQPDAVALELRVSQLNGKLDALALDALTAVRSQLTPAQLAGAQASYLQEKAAMQAALGASGDK